MSKNTRWSAKDFKKKNLVSNKDGVFVNVSSLVQKGNVIKFDVSSQTVKSVEEVTVDKWLENTDNQLKNDIVNTILTNGSCITNTEVDLFGGIKTTIIHHETQLDPTSGEYILWVRTLTGKARDTAVMQLKQATEEMFKNADKDCFFISGNTASSKNGKEIGRFKKRNHLGVLEDFTTLVDSKVTKAYRKSTDGQWLQNKVAFKNAVEGLKIPYNIEFTFIRDSVRRFDLHNAVQVVADMMVEYGWIVDDESCYLNPSFGSTYYHKQLCGVLIKILKP